MLNWLLQSACDKNLIVNSLELKYKKINCFFKHQKVSYLLGYNYKNLRLKVSYKRCLERYFMLSNLDFFKCCICFCSTEILVIPWPIMTVQQRKLLMTVMVSESMHYLASVISGLQEVFDSSVHSLDQQVVSLLQTKLTPSNTKTTYLGYLFGFIQRI